MKPKFQFSWAVPIAIMMVFLLLVPGCSRKDTSVGPAPTPDSSNVHLDSALQIIRGFGAANIVGWRPDMTAGEIQTAFGTGSGQLGFSIMRLRVPPDSAGFAANIPSAEAAYSMGVTIIASPWTPPAWMKSNGSLVGGTLNPSAYAAFASHLKAFSDTMSASGVSLYAISVQNEPDANVSYESCFWNGTQFLNFMKNNAASVGVPVFMPESMNFNHSLSDPALNDPVAAANIGFIGGHTYGTHPSPYPLAAAMGKEVWMTEYLDLDTSWDAALGTGMSIHDCMTSGMSAYVWWYIVRFYGPIDETGVVTRRGYAMSQFSRFVRPGYHRVSAKANPQTNIYVSAYKNGSKVVLVVLNLGADSVSQEFIMAGLAASSFTPYVTSGSKNCEKGNEVPVSNYRFTATLDPSSITTFVSN